MFPQYIPARDQPIRTPMQAYQTGYTDYGLPSGAVPVTECAQGVCLKTTPRAIAQINAYAPSARSYYSFMKAQTLPYQEAFSGLGTTCTGCAPNRYALWIPSQPATQSLLPAVQQISSVPWQVVTPATSALPPVNPTEASYAQRVIEGFNLRAPMTLGYSSCNGYTGL